MTVDPNTHKAVSNFNTHTSFLHASHDVANYANSLLFVLYSFSGYEQPFYVSREIGFQGVLSILLTLRAHLGDERDL